MYGWSFDNISKMTAGQQLQALMQPDDIEGTTKFKDEQELLAFMQKRELTMLSTASSTA